MPQSNVFSLAICNLCDAFLTAITGNLTPERGNPKPETRNQKHETALSKKSPIDMGDTFNP